MDQRIARPSAGGKRPNGAQCVCGHLAKTHTSRQRCTFQSKTGERCACRSIVVAPRVAVFGVTFAITQQGREALEQVDDMPQWDSAS